jgi:WD repeat-containing protein 48
LFSSHPSFEVFYSGDRSGLVCRTDVERCADVSEGECIVLCQDKGEQNLATSEGVSKIISFDDSFVWTATGSSSIKRWRAPQRRSVRVPGSYSVQDGARSPHSPSNPRTSVSPSIVESFRSGASLHRRDRDIDTGDSLNGIPYASLVHLTSLNDPFAPFSTTARGGDADVATLYSAASIMSVPRQARSPSQPAFSPGVDSPGLGPVNTARAEFEEREVATEASPLLDEPDAVITGDTGLVRSIILNDRIHALTIDAHGDVAVWDIVRGVALGRYSRGDIAAASQKGSVSGKSGGSERERSPREALETVRELVEGEAFVLQWCSVDTKTGMLTVNLNDKCLESELYADEAGYERGSFNDEQRSTYNPIYIYVYYH